MKYLTIDIDGVLSDDRWRRHRLPKDSNNPDDYDHYNEGCVFDLACHRDFVKDAWSVYGPGHIWFVTARPAKYRPETNKWIVDNYGLDTKQVNLIMRPFNDRQHSPELKVDALTRLADVCHVQHPEITHIDDRADVVNALLELGFNAILADCNGYLDLELEEVVWSSSDGVQRGDWSVTAEEVERNADAGDLLSEMAETFRERNAQYKDNYKLVGRVLEVLHGPDANVPATELVGTAAQFDIWHLYELIIVKLTRFANSGLMHPDSIRDIGIYCAMIEAILKGKDDETD